MTKKLLLVLFSILFSVNVNALVSVEKFKEMCKPDKSGAHTSECKAFMSGMDHGLMYGALFGSTKIAKMVDEKKFRKEILEEDVSVELVVQMLSSRNLTTMLDYCQEFNVGMSQYANQLSSYIKKEKIDTETHVFMVYKEMLMKNYPLKGCENKNLSE